MRSDWYAPYLFDRLHVYETVADAAELHTAVYQAYFAEADFTDTRFGKYERLHFLDVAQVLDLNRIILIISALLLIGLTWRHPLRFYWMRLGSCYVLALLVGIVLLSTRWLLFFRGMHPLLFSHGHWDFHPNDLILQLYPELLLAIVASVIVLLVLALSVALFFSGIYLERFLPPVESKDEEEGGEATEVNDAYQLFKDKYWHWRKRHGDVALMLSLFMVPAWIFGREMIYEASVAWYYYWLLSALLIAACIASVCIKNMATGALVILASYIWMYAYAEGVSHSTHKAQYHLEVHGQYYVDAIKAFREKYHRLPKDIAELEAKQQSDKLIEATLQPHFDYFHTWQIRHFKNNEYALFFKGPLSFDFSYHSKTDYWNAMRRP